MGYGPVRITRKGGTNKKEILIRIGEYVKHWCRWVRSGVTLAREELEDILDGVSYDRFSGAYVCSCFFIAFSTIFL